VTIAWLIWNFPKLTSLQELGRALVALGIIAVLTGTAATAQNLDQGKSAPKLFADGCAACHRSPRGLAKGRFKFTLYLFLKEHYASGPDSASALASYLESVDSNQRGPSRGAAKPSRSATGTSRSSSRPPKPAPGR
jgi:mono/diheme cytochrome c family protein